MILNNGKDITVLGQVNIENRQHFICKIPNPIYYDGMLIPYMLLPLNAFKEFNDQIHKESDELLNFNNEETKQSDASTANSDI